MKYFFAMITVLLAYQTTNAADLFSCAINKSETLEINRAFNINGENAIQIERVFFNEGRPRTSIFITQATIVEYGSKFILLGNRGRSGYVLLNIDTDTQEGLVDINLFGAQFQALNMRDQKLHCIRTEEK